MSKINILCDGNYLAFAEFSLFSNYGKDKEPLGNERKQASFIQGLVNRIFYTTALIPKGGRFVFCLDSKSWRKSIDKLYKESREDDKGNKGIMDNETKQIFYKILADLGEVLEAAGICVSKVQGAEGDDLLFKWSKYFNERGENCVIITGDVDLTQNVCGPDEAWTIVWNPKTNSNKIYAIDGWMRTLSVESGNSIFDFSLSNEMGEMLKFVKEKQPVIDYINPNFYILKKILVGDDGDDVPAVWEISKPDSKGEMKSTRVTDKRADKILELLFDKYKLTRQNCLVRWNDAEFQDELAGMILRVMGDVDGKEQREEVKLRLALNAKLVWLHEDQLPPNITEMINENIAKSMTLVPDPRRWNKKALLEGSKFQHGSATPTSLDPFGFMNLPDEFTL